MIYFLHDEVNQFEDWPCDILYFPPTLPDIDLWHPKTQKSKTHNLLHLSTLRYTLMYMVCSSTTI